MRLAQARERGGPIVPELDGLPPINCSPSLAFMRAVQTTEFGVPEVLNVVDFPTPSLGTASRSTR